jgi:hypothetical protein
MVESMPSRQSHAPSAVGTRRLAAFSASQVDRHREQASDPSGSQRDPKKRVALSTLGQRQVDAA